MKRRLDKQERKTQSEPSWKPPETQWIKLNCDGASKGKEERLVGVEF